jgi:hypothetical protein
MQSQLDNGQPQDARRESGVYLYCWLRRAKK